MIPYDNKDWLRLTFGWRGSIIPGIATRILAFSVGAAAWTAIHLYVAPLEKIPGMPWTVIGLALGLLLVFRTNTSYDRFWEGRRMWGSIVNNCRSLAVGLAAYVPGASAEAAELRREAARRLCAVPFLIKQRLRLEKNPEEVAEFFSPEERERLAASDHPAVATVAMVSARLARGVERGLLTETRLWILNQHLAELVNALGACERIRHTPLPIAYIFHLKRFVALFLGTLPIPLVEGLRWWTVPVAALCSYAFLGIEEIGVEIEDPFGDDPNDLPLDEICGKIRQTVDDLVEKQAPALAAR